MERFLSQNSVSQTSSPLSSPFPDSNNDVDASFSLDPTLLEPELSISEASAVNPLSDDNQQAVSYTGPSKYPDYSLWTDRNSKIWALLPGYITAHDIKAEKSWYWAHGFRMKRVKNSQHTNNRELVTVWVCETCSRKGKVVVFVANTSRSICTHLAVHKILPPGCSAHKDIADYLGLQRTNPTDQAIAAQLNTSFDPQIFQLLVLDWITYENLAFRTVDSARYRRMMLYSNPILQLQNIPSGQTLVRLIGKEYTGALGQIITLLATARSMIHFTADGWTSRQNVSFLGIQAHFIDQSWQRWNIMLGLVPMLGRHTGKVMSDEILKILSSFNVSYDIVGYFTLDNASNMDTCVEAMAEELPSIFMSTERRIRCAPHFIHLAVRYMMYGSHKVDFSLLDLETLDDIDEDMDMETVLQLLRDDTNLGALKIDQDEELDEDSDTDELPEGDLLHDALATSVSRDLNQSSFEHWHKEGPYGKLHNIGKILRKSSQMKEHWYAAQRETYPTEQPLEWIQNVTTRWSSDFAMADRAKRRKLAVDRMIDNVEEQWLISGGKDATRPAILDERMSSFDWKIVESLLNVLRQFKITATQLQGDGVLGLSNKLRGSTGGFHEYFPSIEQLLDHLETCVSGTCVVPDPDHPTKYSRVNIFAGLDPHSRRLLKVHIKLGWQKLDEYYGKISSLAYVAAVILDPTVKLTGLEELWDGIPQRQKRSWKNDYLQKLRLTWNTQYKDRVLCSQPNESLNIESAFLSIRDRRNLYRKRPLEPDDENIIHSTRDNRQKRRKGKEIKPQNNDELELYLSEPPVENERYSKNPISWWQEIGSRRYPALSYMATDFLTIPSSTANLEREFNPAGRMVTPLRTRLRKEVVSQAICLRNWSKLGVYEPRLPLNLLQGDDWLQNVAAALQKLGVVDDDPTVSKRSD